MRSQECLRRSPVCLLLFLPARPPPISHFTFLDSMSFFFKKYVQISSLAGKQSKTTSVNHGDF